MKISYVVFMFVITSCKISPNTISLSPNQIEFQDFITNLEKEFVYRSDKQSVIDCIKDKYYSDIDTLTKPYFKVLYYETILNELYDSHISLNTNTDRSYRLRSPIYIIERENRFHIKNLFSSQLNTHIEANIIDAEVEQINGLPFSDAINQFPSKCMDQSNPIIREWIANKIVAGKRNEPRVLTLRLFNDEELLLDLDDLRLKEHSTSLDAKVVNGIGYIRINNSLGDGELISAFDIALDELIDTRALILDLRNTPNGGSTDIAEPLMGRFISKEKGYQICENKNQRYTKMVSPRKMIYDKPLYVLVGRWTGSMGEGMAIGLDGMNRAVVVGTEMNRLAGGIKTIQLLNSKFGFNMSFEKMYHLDGTLRESFVPDEYVNQSNNMVDHHMNYVVSMVEASNTR